MINMEDDPTQYNELSTEYKELLDDWISVRLPIARSVDTTRTSYGLKHVFQRETGVYVTNGAFKGAMLAAERKPVDAKAQNWCFRTKLNTQHTYAFTKNVI